MHSKLAMKSSLVKIPSKPVLVISLGYFSPTHRSCCAHMFQMILVVIVYDLNEIIFIWQREVCARERTFACIIGHHLINNKRCLQ